jgi:hypothetical protein
MVKYPGHSARTASVEVLVWLLLVLVCVSISFVNANAEDAAEKATSSGAVVRDGTMKSLAAYLNGKQAVFNQYSGSSSSYEAFIAALYPWVVADLPVPVNSVARTDYSTEPAQCSAKEYSNVLTGVPLKSPKVIVDFVPFGYDVDLLNVRLHETYHAVDVFVIFESTRTQSGLLKPLYYDAVRNSDRFSYYQNKIIYLNATDADLEKFVTQVKKSTTPRMNGGRWALEFAMRTEMIRIFKLIPDSVVLKKMVMDNIKNVWALQNDADEMPSGHVLWNFKNCEMKQDIRAVYLPCLSFKRNFHWLQTTSDMVCFKDLNGRGDELKNYLWRGAPYLWRLAEMLDDGSTLRYHKFKLDPCLHHMGIGAAVHISSVAEPVAFWLKKGYVCENFHC